MDKADWIRVRDDLAARIADGDWGPGDRLPPEPDLCRLFGVGRHSIRRAIHALAVQGTLRAEQGRGTYVQAAPLVSYAIGRRTRFRRNLIEQGLTPAGEVLESSIEPGPVTVAERLQIAENSPVHRMLGRGMADGVPISLNLSWHPVALFPDLGERRRAGQSISAIYHHHGITDYHRQSTVLFARPADPAEAKCLMQHPDLPVVVIAKVDVAPDGRPIGFSEAIWAGSRVQFILETKEDPHD